MGEMAKLQFGTLRDAWEGEARDFTPLLAEQLDAVGDAIGVTLASQGAIEVKIEGGRRIDIVAQDVDGSEFVIENQYGRADHDHLTRGLAYAVARRAQGLVIIAEAHGGEFRAVAEYLNELAEVDEKLGIAVWLVEAKAVRIADSPWAPLFSAVVAPNAFTATVEHAKQSTALPSLTEFWSQFGNSASLAPAKRVVDAWTDAGHRTRLGPNHIVLEAKGPSKNGYRTVVAVYSDGKVLIPFGSYAGQNSGIPIPALTTPTFRTGADSLFGFLGTELQAKTAAGWLTTQSADALIEFCAKVAGAYASELDAPAVM